MKSFIVPEGTKVYIEKVEANRRECGAINAKQDIIFEPSQLIELTGSKFFNHSKEFVFSWHGFRMYVDINYVKIL